MPAKIGRPNMEVITEVFGDGAVATTVETGCVQHQQRWAVTSKVVKRNANTVAGIDQCCHDGSVGAFGQQIETIIVSGDVEHGQETPVADCHGAQRGQLDDLHVRKMGADLGHELIVD